MMNMDLKNFITKQRANGLSQDQIKSNLLSIGWDRDQVETALRTTPPEQEAIPKPPSTPAETPAHSSAQAPGMWDSFQHILMFISMAVLAISLALTLHLYIDKWMPGVTPSYSSSYYSTSEVIAYMAAMIVSFPLFAFFFLKVTKRTQANPSIRNLRSRKFLIYATLVITFLVVMAVIVHAVYGLLIGNFSLNFFLHFLTTVGVSSLIFVYYLTQVKEDRTRKHV